MHQGVPKHAMARNRNLENQFEYSKSLLRSNLLQAMEHHRVILKENCPFQSNGVP